MRGVLTELSSECIVARQDRCVVVRNRNAACRRCAEACTSGAISIDPRTNSIAIEAQKCVGCGTCATVCPTCALEARNPCDADLIARCTNIAGKKGRLTLACSRAAVNEPQGECPRVECLGRVEESLLVSSVAAGASEIALACGDCAACEHRSGRLAAQEVVSTASLLLASWGSDARVSIVGGEPHGTHEAERPRETGAAGTVRDKEGAEKNRAAAPSVRPMKVGPDKTLPHFIPDRRERLLDALAELGKPQAGPIETRLWGTVEIDVDLCTGCRGCATFCPTGAIRPFGDPADGAPYGIDHMPADCVKCLCCEDICRQGAIRVRDDVRAEDLLDGKPQRHEMRPRLRNPGGPTSILDAMRQIIRDTPVYER